MRAGWNPVQESPPGGLTPPGPRGKLLSSNGLRLRSGGFWDGGSRQGSDEGRPRPPAGCPGTGRARPAGAPTEPGPGARGARPGPRPPGLDHPERASRGAGGRRFRLPRPRPPGPVRPLRRRGIPVLLAAAHATALLRMPRRRAACRPLGGGRRSRRVPPRARPSPPPDRPAHPPARRRLVLRAPAVRRRIGAPAPRLAGVRPAPVRHHVRGRGRLRRARRAITPRRPRPARRPSLL
jgi:hypothetical protein